MTPLRALMVSILPSLAAFLFFGLSLMPAALPPTCAKPLVYRGGSSNSKFAVVGMRTSMLASDICTELLVEFNTAPGMVMPGTEMN